MNQSNRDARREKSNPHEKFSAGMRSFSRALRSLSAIEYFQRRSSHKTGNDLRDLFERFQWVARPLSDLRAIQILCARSAPPPHANLDPPCTVLSCCHETQPVLETHLGMSSVFPLAATRCTTRRLSATVSIFDGRISIDIPSSMLIGAEAINGCRLARTVPVMLRDGPLQYLQHG